MREISETVECLDESGNTVLIHCGIEDQEIGNSKKNLSTGRGYKPSVRPKSCYWLEDSGEKVELMQDRPFGDTYETTDGRIFTPIRNPPP